MSAVWTIAKRELTGMYFSPIAYLVLGIFAFVTSLLFFAQYGPGQPATMRGEFTWLVWLLVFLSPAISMRSISEELKSGTIEMLMTAPISDTQVVLGKWLGAVGFFLTLLIPVLLQVALLELTAEPDYGPIFTGLLGLILVGALYLAIGVFVSTLTDSQLIAFITTALITGFLTIGLYMISAADFTPLAVKDVLYYINVNQQFEAFAKGLIDVRNFVFFLSGSALFLFFGIKLLESRRWR